MSAGLLMSWCAVSAAEPAPQYSVDDVAKSFAEAPSDDQAGPAVAPGVCEARGKVTGPDGLCESPKDSTAGFNLGRKPTTPAGQAVAKAAPPRGPTRAIVRANPQKDLLITFKLGSAELTDQGRANAEVFAKALKIVPQLADARFQLAGYTDSSGSKDKNAALAQHRADAVKTFLVAQGVDGSRLTAQGYGAQNFLIGVPTTAPENRRVVAMKQ